MKPDYNKYMPLLAKTELTESEKVEFLDTVYVFLCGIVDCQGGRLQTAEDDQLLP